MSLASRLCTSFLQRSLRLFSFGTMPARNYNIMMRPAFIAAPTTCAALPIGGVQRLLEPVSSLLTQVAGFKVKGRLRRRCKDCYFVIRHQRHYIICPTHPRHKQMSMKQRDYKSWILTHATQSKVRPF